MLNFILKRVPHTSHSISRISPSSKPYFLQFNPLSVAAAKPLPENANQNSFTVNYLVSKCGFSPKKALAASKYIKIDKPEKPDAVISFFKNLGFTEAQIVKMVRYYPPVILCEIEKTLLPKIQFFQSQGFSAAELPSILSVIPIIFARNLDRKIIPAFRYIQSLLSVEGALVAIKRCPAIVTNFHCHVVPNVETLRKFQIPEANIAFLLKTYPHAYALSPERFSKLVDAAKRMGFDPLLTTFTVAVNVMGSLTKLNWENKMEVYKKLGFSENEVLMAFRLYPLCMLVSVNKLEGIMEVLVNKMGWRPSVLLQTPHILSYSLSRRIVPRCSVYQALRSRGLVEEEPSSVYTFLKITEDLFLEKYVNRFKEESHDLLQLYLEKKELAA